MGREEERDDLVGYLYETSVNPGRLFDLIHEWDSRIAAGDPGTEVRLGRFADAGFLRHVERAIEVLDELNAFEFGRLDDLLAGMPTAAMVLTDQGVVVAANAPAQAAFGLFPGGSIATMRAGKPDLDEFAERVAAVARDPGVRDDVVRLALTGRARPVLFHLRTLAGGRSHRHALAVSAEHLWQDAAGRVLERVFGLTAAEIGLVRQLTAGASVREIAEAGGRSEGTVRAQLHSVLGKTGVRTQGELVRLATMLLQGTAFDAPRAAGRRALPHLMREPARRSVRLADGREIAFCEYGDPAGRPVVWLQAVAGLFQPTAPAEREMIRRGLRIVVPFRAGYGASDPAPAGRDVIEGSAADIAEALRLAGIARCPVVSQLYDIRIALALARLAPGQVERIVGLACIFPARSMAQFRRMRPMARFVVTTVRFAPQLLPFIIRAFYADMRRSGLHTAVRKFYRDVPADARALADPEISEAVTGAYGLVHTGESSIASYCAESRAFEAACPPGFGDVACPVTLINGEADGGGLCETALEYCAQHPGWRSVTFPDEGQLVGFTQWPAVLDAIEGRLGAASLPSG